MDNEKLAEELVKLAKEIVKQEGNSRKAGYSDVLFPFNPLSFFEMADGSGKMGWYEIREAEEMLNEAVANSEKKIMAVVRKEIERRYGKDLESKGLILR